MKAKDLLRALLIDFHGAIRHPKTARALCFCVTNWPGFTGQMIREIHLHNGNWRLAVRDLLDHREGVPALPRDRVAAFAAWAEQITARPGRGLLTQGGGQ